MASTHFSKEQLYILNGMRKAKALISTELPLSPSDTIVASSPKCGATWLKSLAFSIVTRTRFDLSSKHHPILSTVSHDLVPIIEVDIAVNRTPRDPKLPLLSTHLPLPDLPDPVLESGCKIVYICRNPKDVLVSYWHFLRKHTGNQVEEERFSLETVFDRFCSKLGAGVYGNYWDHVLGYWKASLDYPGRILFLKYEDMMGDPTSIVKRLADFTGYSFSKEEEESGMDTRIVEMCSFKSLSELEVNKNGTHRDTFSNTIYFRKGKVGDWSNYLTPEMVNKIDLITLEKFANLGLSL